MVFGYPNNTDLMLLEQNLKAHKNIIIYPKEYTFIYNNLFWYIFNRIKNKIINNGNARNNEDILKEDDANIELILSKKKKCL